MDRPIYAFLSDIMDDPIAGQLPDYEDTTETFRKIASLETRFARWCMSLPPHLTLDQDYAVADARAVILGLRALTIRTIYHRPFLALAIQQDAARNERSLPPVAGLLPYEPHRAQEAYQHDFIGQR